MIRRCVNTVEDVVRLIIRYLDGCSKKWWGVNFYYGNSSIKSRETRHS